MSSEIVPLPDDPRAETAVNQGVRTYGELHPLPTNEKKKRPLSEAARVARIGRGCFDPPDGSVDKYYNPKPLEFASTEAREEQMAITHRWVQIGKDALRAIRRGEDFKLPGSDEEAPDNTPSQPELPLE